MLFLINYSLCVFPFNTNLFYPKSSLFSSSFLGLLWLMIRLLNHIMKICVNSREFTWISFVSFAEACDMPWWKRRLIPIYLKNTRPFKLVPSNQSPNHSNKGSSHHQGKYNPIIINYFSRLVSKGVNGKVVLSTWD